MTIRPSPRRLAWAAIRCRKSDFEIGSIPDSSDFAPELIMIVKRRYAATGASFGMSEEKNPKSEDIDVLTTEEILSLINEEDATVIRAVREALPSIAKAVDEAVSVIGDGGRIYYAGAGTSGRLGVLDASEMPPTFGIPPDLFQAIIAGGDEALRKAIEGAEDDAGAGERAASALTEKDMAFGISASGRTPFVLSFLAAANEKGVRCRLLTCSERGTPGNDRDKGTPSVLPVGEDRVIRLITGPEIIAGSTRMKAGTATKLALNMFSSALMIRLGRVYRGLMVDVMPANLKLIKRAERAIASITGCTAEEASDYLRRSGMRPKVAIVMRSKGVSMNEAERLLDEAGGFLRRVIG